MSVVTDQWGSTMVDLWITEGRWWVEGCGERVHKGTACKDGALREKLKDFTSRLSPSPSLCSPSVLWGVKGSEEARSSYSNRLIMKSQWLNPTKVYFFLMEFWWAAILHVMTEQFTLFLSYSSAIFPWASRVTVADQEITWNPHTSF